MDYYRSTIHEVPGRAPDRHGIEPQRDGPGAGLRPPPASRQQIREPGIRVARTSSERAPENRPVPPRNHNAPSSCSIRRNRTRARFTRWFTALVEHPIWEAISDGFHSSTSCSQIALAAAGVRCERILTTDDVQARTVASSIRGSSRSHCSSRSPSSAILLRRSISAHNRLRAIVASQQKSAASDRRTLSGTLTQ